MFNFFSLTVPVQDVPEPIPAVQDGLCQYPLFAHQRAAARKVIVALEKHPRRVVLHMPTGAGKTRTAMHVIADHLRRREPTLVVWLAHTEELCEQAALEFEQAWHCLGNREVGVYRFWGNRELPLDKVHDGILIGGLAKMYRTTKNHLSFIIELAGRTSEFWHIFFKRVALRVSYWLVLCRQRGYSFASCPDLSQIWATLLLISDQEPTWLR